MITKIAVNRSDGTPDEFNGAFTAVTVHWHDGTSQVIYGKEPAAPPVLPAPGGVDFGHFILAPATYTGGDLPFIPGPDFPRGGDIVFQTWSKVSKAIEADRLFSAPPFVYPAGRLATVTPGPAIVQALIRDAKRKHIAKVELLMEFPAAGTPVPGPVPEPPTPPPPTAYDPSSRVALPAPPRTDKKVLVNANPGSITMAQMMVSDDCRVQFVCGKVYDLPASFTIRHDRVIVEAVGDGHPPVLLANGSETRCIVVSGGSSDVVIRGLLCKSTDSVGSQPNAFEINGDRVLIEDCQVEGVDYAFGFGAGQCDNVLIRRCSDTKYGAVEKYFAYPKGRRIAFVDCVSHGAQAGFLRTNECFGLTIDGCISRGGTKDGKFHDRFGRLIVQYASDVVIRNTQILNSAAAFGPLWNVDGWKQKVSEADFVARRTKQVRIENLKMTGGGSLEINRGVEDCRITGYSGGTIRYQSDEKPDYAKHLTLPGPDDVLVNGVKPPWST